MRRRHPIFHGLAFFRFEVIFREHIYIDVHRSIWWQVALNEFSRGDPHQAAGVARHIGCEVEIDVAGNPLTRDLDLQIEVRY